MQTIKQSKSYKNIHWLLNDIERLYGEVSDRIYTPQTSLIPHKYDDSFNILIDILYRDGGIDTSQIKTEHKAVNKIITNTDEKNILVCFSGGKDSFSVAKYYKDLGYNVKLFHIQGLNYTYCGQASEHTFAQECADYLDLPLYIDHVSYTGYHNWIEHPMKNFIMLNHALTYAINTNFTTQIAVGTFSTATLIDNAFDVCGGDCIEMWSAYENIVGRFLDNFNILIPNANYETAFKMLQTVPDAIEHTISCMTSNRFRNQNRTRIQSKYNINLFRGRCGVCWKCAVEYIWCADHDIVEYNEQYYLKCIMCLHNTIIKETGYRENYVEYIWRHYFFYPISQSKAKEKLIDGVISNGKIKRAN